MEIKDTWKRTKDFCPGCGVQSVWVEDSSGDYYEGPTLLCTACSSSFSLPRFVDAKGKIEIAILKTITADSYIIERIVPEPSSLAVAMNDYYSVLMLEMLHQQCDYLGEKK